jgi:hypothetical protein
VYIGAEIKKKRGGDNIIGGGGFFSLISLDFSLVMDKHTSGFVVSCVCIKKEFEN